MKLTKTIVLAAAFLLLSSSVTVATEKTDTEKKKIDVCVGNLKQIGLGMFIYADDNKSMFPAGDNIEGLQKIVASYLGKRPQILICPDDKKNKIGKINHLQENNSSYIYFDIERSISKVRRPSQTVLVCDKPGNHNGFVNVLYLDGHVMRIKTNKNYSCEAILKVIYKNNFSYPIRKLQLKKAKEMDKKFGWKKPIKQQNELRQ